MLNRRSMLFNVVTLTINSNVSSTITIGGEVFTNVTTASKRFRQGTETSYKVEAQNYVTKSGTIVMSGNSEVDVILELDTVTFTLKMSPLGTITINGTSYTSVSSKSVDVVKGSTVTWSAEAAGRVSQSGTEYVTDNVTKSVTLSLIKYTLSITIPTMGSIAVKDSLSLSRMYYYNDGENTYTITVYYGDRITWSARPRFYKSVGGETIKITGDTNISVSLSDTSPNDNVVSECTEGYIWCTDGSFVRPDYYKSSGKTAYGYACMDRQVIALFKSQDKYEWSPVTSSYYSYISGVNSTTNGVSNSNKLRNLSDYSEFNCPALYHCLTDYSNAGVSAYMPSYYEAESAYGLIYGSEKVDYNDMFDVWKNDIVTAGLYDSLDYRSGVFKGGVGVWTSTQCTSSTPGCTNDTYPNMAHAYVGYHYYNVYDKSSQRYIIPFFKFSDRLL